MLKVSQALPSRSLAFKSTGTETDKPKRTHAGVITGAVAGLSVPAADILWSKSLKGLDWKASGIAVVVSAGFGALADLLINNKFKKGEKNNAVGKKYGAISGAVGLPLLMALDAGKRIFTKRFAKALPIFAAVGALGGLALGAITDFCANRTPKAKKETKDTAEKA